MKYYFIIYSIVFLCSNVYSENIIGCKGITISKSTSYITKEINKNGCPDYNEYLNLKHGKVNVENNSAIEFIKVFGLREFYENADVDKISRKLKSKELLPLESQWVPISKYKKSFGYSNIIKCIRSIDTCDVDSEAKKWMSDNDNNINSLIRASQRTGWYLPWYKEDRYVSSWTAKMVLGSEIQEFTLALFYRAKLNLNDLNYSGWSENIYLINKLSSLLLIEPSMLIFYMATDNIVGANEAINQGANKWKISGEYLSKAIVNLQELQINNKLINALEVDSRITGLTETLYSIKEIPSKKYFLSEINRVESAVESCINTTGLYEREICLHNLSLDYHKKNKVLREVRLNYSLSKLEVTTYKNSDTQESLNADFDHLKKILSIYNQAEFKRWMAYEFSYPEIEYWLGRLKDINNIVILNRETNND
jgi:hypothetical protein